MSKWSKRSDAEKAEILRKQQAIKDAAELKKVRGTPLILKDEDASKIYESVQIPLPCLNCGWRGSEHYRVYTGRDVLGRTDDFIEGKCSQCGQLVKRAFPSSFSAEGLMFVMVASNLAREGKLIDERKGAGKR